jgi:hypothetical protein
MLLFPLLHQRVDEQLTPTSYFSRLLTPVEQGYSTYEKECLAVLFGFERCRPYLEHKVFELHCDNFSLCWLLNRAKNVGRLAPFKFRVRHTRGTDNVVADALSRMFDRQVPETLERAYVILLQSLPLVYSSLSDHQKKDPFCVDLRARILGGQEVASEFQLSKELLCYQPLRAKRRRFVIPVSLRPMVLQYFHDFIHGGHLGSLKTFQKIAANFYWPKMRSEIFECVRACDLCHRAKPAQNTAVGLHQRLR